MAEKRPRVFKSIQSRRSTASDWGSRKPKHWNSGKIQNPCPKRPPCSAMVSADVSRRGRGLPLGLVQLPRSLLLAPDAGTARAPGREEETQRGEPRCHQHVRCRHVKKGPCAHPCVVPKPSREAGPTQGPGQAWGEAREGAFLRVCSQCRAVSVPFWLQANLRYWALLARVGEGLVDFQDYRILSESP